MILLQLFYEFALIGLFSIGGGLATLPFLYNLSDKTGWFTYQSIAEMIAISESTPGPIGINMATYVGFLTHGISGAIIATVGLILPGMIIVTLVARMLARFKDSSLVGSAFYGLRAAVAGLVASAAWSVMQVSLVDLPNRAVLWAPIVLFGAFLFVHMRFKKVHPVLLIAAGAAIGIVLKL